MLAIDTTPALSEVTCAVCLKCYQALQRFELYAGEKIPTVQIMYWDELPRSAKYRHCRKFEQTKYKHGFKWYQFSRQERDLLLSSIRFDGNAARQLCITGIEAEATPEHIKEKFRAQYRLIQRVLGGRQSVETLQAALLIQEEIMRGLDI